MLPRYKVSRRLRRLLIATPATRCYCLFALLLRPRFAMLLLRARVAESYDAARRCRRR